MRWGGGCRFSFFLFLLLRQGGWGGFFFGKCRGTRASTKSLALLSRHCSLSVPVHVCPAHDIFMGRRIQRSFQADEHRVSADPRLSDSHWCHINERCSPGRGHGAGAHELAEGQQELLRFGLGQLLQLPGRLPGELGDVFLPFLGSLFFFGGGFEHT